MEDVPLEVPATKSHTGALARKVGAAKRIGRASAKYQFTIRVKGITGLPALPKCSGVALQLSRGRGKTVTTSQAACSDSGVSWEGEVLLIDATLRQSKTGKETGFSEKAYKVSLVGVFEKRLRELARSEINLAALTGATMPAARSMQLAPNKKHLVGVKGMPVLQLEVAALETSGADDSDDDASVTTEGSNRSGATWMSASVASDGFDQEQDLAGFEAAKPALLPIGEDQSLKLDSMKSPAQERPQSPWSEAGGLPSMSATEPPPEVRSIEYLVRHTHSDATVSLDGTPFPRGTWLDSD